MILLSPIHGLGEVPLARSAKRNFVVYARHIHHTSSGNSFMRTRAKPMEPGGHGLDLKTLGKVAQVLPLRRQILLF